MAQLINGKIYGKIGDMVGSSWKGKHYMKRAPKPSDKPKTEKQLAQQAKFAWAMRFLNPVRDLLSVGMGTGKKPLTGHNLALRYLLRAISGTQPDYVIDYAAIQFTKGTAGRLAPINVRIDPEGLSVSWFFDGFRYGGYHDDEIGMLIYEPQTGTFLRGPAGIHRMAGSLTMTIPDELCGKTVHFYLYSRSYRNNFSPSEYAGMFEIPVGTGLQLNTGSHVR